MPIGGIGVCCSLQRKFISVLLFWFRVFYIHLSTVIIKIEVTSGVCLSFKNSACH